MARLLLGQSPAFVDNARHQPPLSLPTWLNGDWAILFSHAEDFAPGNFEDDRWRVMMERAFVGRGVRPLILASESTKQHDSWVTTITGDAGDVTLATDTPLNFLTGKVQGSRLLNEITALSTERFVMIIDDTLFPHRTFTYNQRVNLPSPLEFLGWADTLRAKRDSTPPARSRGYRDFPFAPSRPICYSTC
jgi:alkyl hydroperoxide reductase subunit AhpC